MRVLVISNMAPDAAAPQRGSFVRDQVAALRELGLDVSTYDWPAGSRHYLPAARHLRRLLSDVRPDVVHAHYGLAGWCAVLAGARPLMVTFHGTDVRHRVVGPLSRQLTRRPIFVAAVSEALFAPEAGRPGLPRPAGRSGVLPCGADLERFHPIDRGEARSRLGLDPDGRYLLFPASASRPVKRHDRAADVAERAGAQLLTLGSVDPAEVPLWVNACSAVLITSENEGFGLAAVEALACDVAVLSTPVGAAPQLLENLDGCLSAPFDPDRWAGLARRRLDDPGARVAGRERAGRYGSRPMAERVAAAYQKLAGIA